MKLKIFFLILLLTSILDAKTSDFSIIIDKPFNAALLDITQNYDRSITAIGFINAPKNSFHKAKAYTDPYAYLRTVSNQYGAKIQMLQVDKKAHILLSKVISNAKFAKPASLVKTPTNGYFIGGYTMDGSELLLLVDNNMNILHSKYFGTKNYDKMNKLVPLKDGGVLAVGTSFTSRSPHDKLFDSGLGNDDISISRFNKNGRLLWSKKYGTEDDDRGIDAAQAEDGSIVVLGTTHTKEKTNVTISHLTQNGDTIWVKKIPNKVNLQAISILKLRDNNFVLSSSEFDTVGKKQIRLIKFDIHKNILVNKLLSTVYSSQLNDIQEFSDGKLIGVGSVKDTFNTDALAIILSNNLKLLKQEHYGGDNYDVFNKAVILNNTQVGVVGIHTNKNSNENNMWIVKLNKDATLASIAMNTQDFYHQLYHLFRNEIKEGKLSIKENLTIEFKGDTLHFKAGAYKLSQEQKQFVKNFSKKLIPFLYAHKSQVKSLKIDGYTSSEWENTKFTNRYLNNEELSMKRSYETLKSLFIQQSDSKQNYLSKILQGSGLSYQERIITNKKEDKEKSRRVNFQIILH